MGQPSGEPLPELGFYGLAGRSDRRTDLITVRRPDCTGACASSRFLIEMMGDLVAADDAATQREAARLSGEWMLGRGCRMFGAMNQCGCHHPRPRRPPAHH